MSESGLVVTIDRVEIIGAPSASHDATQLRALVEREVARALSNEEGPRHSLNSRRVTIDRTASPMANDTTMAQAIAASVIEAIGRGAKPGEPHD